MKRKKCTVNICDKYVWKGNTHNHNFWQQFCAEHQTKWDTFAKEHDYKIEDIPLFEKQIEEEERERAVSNNPYCKHCGNWKGLARVKDVGVLCWKCIRLHGKDYGITKSMLQAGLYEEIKDKEE